MNDEREHPSRHVEHPSRQTDERSKGCPSIPTEPHPRS